MTSTLTFKFKMKLDMPLEVESICPNVLAGKNIEDIKKLSAYEGNAQHTIGDAFDISGDVASEPSDMKIVIKDSSTYLKRIGENMTAGEIEIHGDVGMHLGDFMKGGKILVHGNVDKYCASQMEGGEIHIEGDAGDYLCAAYRGNWRGMKGGKVIVNGNAGFEIAAWLRGTKATRAKGEPLVHVKGNVGLHAGHHNHGGFLVVEGDSEGRLGSEMGRGDIVLLGKTDMLSTFLKDDGEVAEIAEIGMKGPFISYSGDQAIGGKGKIYVKK
ncbi:MAG: formylmethanofuran dehydrogenase subunit C [Candidatus Hodarchaeota archaeon]